MGLSGRGGQSLVELGVFGGLFVIVMGAMISYGMTNDYQQRVQMRTFRDGLQQSMLTSQANTPTSVNLQRIETRAVPDPNDPLGLGTTTTVSASAGDMSRSVVPLAPDLGNTRELPVQRMIIDGREFDCPGGPRGCTTAGFRRVGPVPGWTSENGRLINNPDTNTLLDIYDQVYGMSSLRAIPGSCGLNGCNVEIVDPVCGELVNPNAAPRICRQLADIGACRKECVRGRDPSSRLDCNAVCSPANMATLRATMPWYCDASRPPKYLSTQLNNLFPNRAVNPIEAMGLQSGGRNVQSRRETEIRSVATSSGLTTEEKYTWHESIRRRIAFRRMSANNTSANSLIEQNVPRAPKRDTNVRKPSWSTPW